MNPTTLFLTGIGVGTGLLVLGLLLGIWLGRRSSPADNSFSRDQFLIFLKNLSTWTNDIAGDVSKYQSQLNTLSRGVDSNFSKATPEQVQQLLNKIMDANQQLQTRLDATEIRLECQTKEIADYLTEARTDSLTGLANRRAFDQQLDIQFKEFKQSQSPFSLALIDIDHFKKINDTYGHPAGVAVLCEMAGRLKQVLSDAIQIARYGGEEFAILFNKPLQDTAAIMDQARKIIASEPVEAEGHSIKFTISSGVAEVQSDERIGKLVRRSDDALYSAKLGGRNRVYLHDGKMCHLFGKPGERIPDGAPAIPTPNDDTQSPNQIELMRRRLQDRLDRIVSEEAKRQSV